MIDVRTGWSKRVEMTEWGEFERESVKTFLSEWTERTAEKWEKLRQTKSKLNSFNLPNSGGGNRKAI